VTRDQGSLHPIQSTPSLADVTTGVWLSAIETEICYGRSYGHGLGQELYLLYIIIVKN